MESEQTNTTPEPNQNIWTKVTPFSKYLAMILFILLPFVGGYVGYRYAPDKVVEMDVIEVSSTTNEPEDMHVKTQSTTLDDMISYTSPVFGITFMFPEKIDSFRSDFKGGKYYGPEAQVTEAKAIEILGKSGSSAGWNAGLLDNCPKNEVPYCSSVSIGIWPVLSNSNYSNKIPELSNSDFTVYFDINEYNPENDLSNNGWGSVTHYSVYEVVSHERNLAVHLTFLTAKHQGAPLSPVEIDAEKDFHNHIKKTIVPEIIKSIKNTNTKKFELRTPYSM